MQEISRSFIPTWVLACCRDHSGSIAVAFGIGIEEASDRIYFPQIISTAVALKQEASWRRVGALDVSLPIALDVSNDPRSLTPIITIADGNLFDTVEPSINLDFDMR